MDDLTLPRLNALMGYWLDHPPLHIMVAAYLGFKPSEAGTAPAKEEPRQIKTQQDAEDFIRCFQMAGGQRT